MFAQCLKYPISPALRRIYISEFSMTVQHTMKFSEEVGAYLELVEGADSAVFSFSRTDGASLYPDITPYTTYPYSLGPSEFLSAELSNGGIENSYSFDDEEIFVEIIDASEDRITFKIDYPENLTQAYWASYRYDSASEMRPEYDRLTFWWNTSRDIFGEDSLGGEIFIRDEVFTFRESMNIRLIDNDVSWGSGWNDFFQMHFDGFQPVKHYHDSIVALTSFRWKVLTEAINTEEKVQKSIHDLGIDVIEDLFVYAKVMLEECSIDFSFSGYSVPNMSSDDLKVFSATLEDLGDAISTDNLPLKTPARHSPASGQDDSPFQRACPL